MDMDPIVTTVLAWGIMLLVTFMCLAVVIRTKEKIEKDEEARAQILWSRFLERMEEADNGWDEAIRKSVGELRSSLDIYPKYEDEDNNEEEEIIDD